MSGHPDSTQKYRAGCTAVWRAGALLDWTGARIALSPRSSLFLAPRCLAIQARSEERRLGLQLTIVGSLLAIEQVSEDPRAPAPRLPLTAAGGVHDA